MKLIRIAAFAAAAFVLWRMLTSRGVRPLRWLPFSQRETRTVAPPSSARHHTSAASAANEDFRDDRDVIVGENLTAVGIRPGAI